MENNEAFEAEAALEARSRSYQSRYHGNGSGKASSSRIGTRKENDYDETPLLSREIDNDYGSTSDALDNEDSRGPPEWSGERDFEGKSWWNKPSVFWLLPPFFLFTLAIGGIAVPRLNLILDLVCRQYFIDRPIDNPTTPIMPVILGVDNPQCKIPEIQSLVSRFTLYQSIIAGLLSAVTSPQLGTLSDRYGRKRMIAFTILGALISEVIIIIAALYPDTVSVNWILLGSFFEGLCGSFVAALALTNAYASDCTAPSRRAVTFGYFHAILFGGIALGPIATGYLVKETNNILIVFYLALGCHSIFFLFLVFLVPESLSHKRQLAAREKKDFVGQGEQNSQTWENTLIKGLRGANIFAPLAILWPTGEGTKAAVRRNLVLLASVDTIMFGVAMGSMTVVVYFSGFMFGWGTFETSIFVSIANICRVSCLVALLPLIVYLCRGPKTDTPTRQSGSGLADLSIIRAAVFFDMLGYMGYAIARTGSWFIVSGAVASVGGMGSPTLQSAITKHVPPDQTGQVLGAMGLLHALARVVGPTIFNLIYSLTVGKFTQTVFVCLAATFGVAFFLSWFIKPHVHWDEPLSRPSTDGDEEQNTLI